MRVLAVFRKSLLEQLRELWLLALVLSLAPFFVVLYAMVFGSGAWSFRIAVVDLDAGAALAGGQTLHAGVEVEEALADSKNATGTNQLTVLRARSRAEGEKLLTTGKAHALIELPSDFSASIAAAREHRPGPRAQLVYMGDLTSQSYVVAAVLAITAVSTYVEASSGVRLPVDLVEKPLGGSGARSELDMALPGVFIFGIVLLLFPVAMSLARESDSGTLRRLMLSRVSAFDLLAGLSLVQVLVGILAVACAYGAALAVGFRSQGPLWVGLLVCVVASFSAIGVGLLVAGVSRSVTEAFLLGNFPMMLLLFFSGSIIPIPKVPLVTLGPVTIGLWDVLPTTHAVSAVNKVMGIGLGLQDVAYELVSLVVLSALYFVVGVKLFQERRMATV